MIIIRYLVLITLKNQVSALSILFLIFSCQTLIKILSATIEGKVSISLFLSLLGLGVSEMSQLILPLSLFLSWLMTLKKLHADNEITAMYACGVSKILLIKIAIILAFFTGIMTLSSIIWVGPWSSRQQYKILTQAKFNPEMIALSKGQFHQITDDHSVLFIEKIDNVHFYDIFFAQKNPKNCLYSSIIVADSGLLETNEDGSQRITLNRGKRFERVGMRKDFRITDFQKYQVLILHKKNNLYINIKENKNMNMYMLWNTNTNSARAELHWRITLVATSFIMALMVIPLSTVNSSNKKKFLSTLSAIILYLVFFLLHTSIKANAEKGKIDPILWVWMINIIYIFLAIIFNFLECLSARYIKESIIFLYRKK